MTQNAEEAYSRMIGNDEGVLGVDEAEIWLGR